MNNVNPNVNPIKNSTPFTPSTQPSPEAKKAGWERKRQAQKMMDKISEYMEMTQKDFMELLNDIKNNPDKHTVGDILLYKYATKAFNGEKFMLDWFDRNISKAPSQLEGSDGEPIRLVIERKISDMTGVNNDPVSLS